MKNILATVGAVVLIAVLLKLNGIWPHQEHDIGPSPETGTAIVGPPMTPASGLQAVLLPHAPGPASDVTASAPITFMGAPCFGDCTVMLAGYRWAEEHGIADSTSCPGSADFGRGCRLFADDERDFNR